MKLNKFFSLLIAMFILIISCTEDNNQIATKYNQKGDKVQSVANRLEWVGVAHNDLLEYVLNNFSYELPSQWPDYDFIDYISDMADDYISGYFPDSLISSCGDLSDTTTMNLLIGINNVNTTISNYRYQIYNSNILTQRDITYSIKVLDLAENLIDSSNVLSYNDIMNRINDVEDEILSINWNNTENLALFSIALFKNSIIFHANYSSALNKKSNNNSIQVGFTPTELTVCGTIDFIAGAATTLSCASASGGMAAVPALVVGIKVGGKASGLANLVGRLFRWW